MVERKKRKHNQRNNNEGKRNQKRRVSHVNDEKINRDELVVYRILCPIDVVGGVIEDALLKVHDAIVACAGENTKIDRDDKQECHLLVPSRQCSSVIGKAGSNIKRIRSRTRASVKVVSKDVSDPSHVCAMEYDNIVVISGEPESVKKELFAVPAIMYKINPCEQIPLDSTGQDVTASCIVPSNLSNSVYPQTGFYSNQDHILQHKAGVPSYFNALYVSDFQGYAETAVNPMPVFASSLPVTHGFYGSSRTEELVLKVLCPLTNITRVIGKGGSTIERIREASGSLIEVND